jgi:chaperone modulatory protein CbpM
MISIDVVIARFEGLDRSDLERWIENDWVRPDGADGQYLFREIDIARIQLIRNLREEMDVNEAALPVVLKLLDQLYALRRQLRDRA